VVLGTVSLLLAYTASFFWPLLSLPLDANVAAAALPLFLLGYLFRRHDRRWFALVSFPGTLAAIFLIAHHPNMTVDMKTGHYGVPFLSLLLALCCIHATILLSRAICGFAAVRLLLGPLGRSSLGIMFIHPFLLANRFAARLDGYNVALAFCVVITGSYFASRLLGSTELTRVTFLGMMDSEPPRPLAGYRALDA
jgi:fucose 4-O-acetylase-like acetyltransferase